MEDTEGEVAAITVPAALGGVDPRRTMEDARRPRVDKGNDGRRAVASRGSSPEASFHDCPHEGARITRALPRPLVPPRRDDTGTRAPPRPD
jgi:hypothetical protein